MGARSMCRIYPFRAIFLTQAPALEMLTSVIRSWIAASSSDVTMTCRWTFRFQFSISVPTPTSFCALLARLLHFVQRLCIQLRGCMRMGVLLGTPSIMLQFCSVESSAVFRSLSFPFIAILLIVPHVFCFRFWLGSFEDLPSGSIFEMGGNRWVHRSGLPGAGFNS